MLKLPTSWRTQTNASMDPRTSGTKKQLRYGADWSGKLHRSRVRALIICREAAIC